MKRKFALYLVFGTMLFGTFSMLGSVYAQQGPLTMAMILTGLQTRGTTPATSTLAKRNVYIQRQIEARGVNFVLTADRERDLRDAGATASLIAAIRANGPSEPEGPEITTKFNRAWVDTDVEEGGQRGLRIHADFEVGGLKGVDSKVLFRVQRAETGQYIKSSGSNRNSAGELQYAFDMKPGFATTAYNDADVFIPYDDLGVTSGEYTFKFDIDLAYGDGTLIKHLEWHEAVVTIPGEVTASVSNIWIDYNVTRNGKKGMVIHVTYQVTGLKGVPSLLAIRVQKENGEFLENTGANSNDDGELEVVFNMTPGFPTTEYKNAEVFLPYSDIILPKGQYDLKLDIDLRYANHELIQHLDFKEFQFSRG